MTDTMLDVMTKEKARLAKHRAELEAQQKDIDTAIAALDRELAAITAWETARTGKPATTSGPKRDQVLALIQEHTALSRAELISLLAIKGNKSHSQALSNMLTALTKANKLSRTNGKYSLTPSP